MSERPGEGHYTGSRDTCPKCGAPHNRRQGRRLAVAALILVAAILVLAWRLNTPTSTPTAHTGQANTPACPTQAFDLAVRDEPTPTAPELAISQIDENQSGKWIVVHGQVTSVSPLSSGFKLTLDDGSGEIALLLKQDLYNQVSNRGALVAGAVLRVQGPINTNRDKVEIVPEQPADIKVLVLAPTRVAPASTSTPIPVTSIPLPAPLGQTTTVSATVQDAISFSQGFKFILDDGDDQLVLLTWLEIYDGIAGREGLRPGALVQVTGEVGQFNDEKQIIPAKSADVNILAAGSTPATVRECGSLTADQAGDWAAVEAQVIHAQPFKDGLRVYLDDGSGEIVLLLWQNVLDRVPGAKDLFNEGDWLRVTGKIEAYEGTLEIVPVLPFDLEAVAPKSPLPTIAPATSPTGVPMGALAAASAGQEMTVAGQVVNAASFSQGFKFTLDDGSGQIVLLMWHNVYDACTAAPQLNIGATVQTSGEIAVYEGELQIQPASGAGVVVTAPGAPAVAGQKISAMGDHVGQRLAITGQVVRAEATGSASKLYVADDTGTALVLIWNNVYERIPNRQMLAVPGTRVRIVGLVQEYRGDLELVPALPYDVEVLE